MGRYVSLRRPARAREMDDEEDRGEDQEDAGEESNDMKYEEGEGPDQQEQRSETEEDESHAWLPLMLALNRRESSA